MNFPEKAIVPGPRSFVSEKEIDDRRKKRQEEWEKTRKPDDPEGELIPDRLIPQLTPVSRDPVLPQRRRKRSMIPARCMSDCRRTK